MAGPYDVVVAAGVEVMSLVPMGASAMVPDVGVPFGPTVGERYEPVGGLVPQGISAEMIADQWDLSREDLDALRRPQPAAGRRGPPPRAASSGRSSRSPSRHKDKETGKVIESRRDW